MCTFSQSSSYSKLAVPPLAAASKVTSTPTRGVMAVERSGSSRPGRPFLSRVSHRCAGKGPGEPGQSGCPSSGTATGSAWLWAVTVLTGVGARNLRFFAFLLQSGTLQQSSGPNGASPDPGPMKAPSFCPQGLTGVQTLGRTVEPLHFLAGARLQRVNTSAVSKVICEEY